MVMVRTDFGEAATSRVTVEMTSHEQEHLHQLGQGGGGQRAHRATDLGHSLQGNSGSGKTSYESLRPLMTAWACSE
jgi:hypothetical protein